MKNLNVILTDETWSKMKEIKEKTGIPYVRQLEFSFLKIYKGATNGKQ